MKVQARNPQTVVAQAWAVVICWASFRLGFRTFQAFIGHFGIK